MRTLVWFRGKDLRISDHTPLASAIETAETEGDVVCVFTLDPYFFEKTRARELPHRMQFLLESLRALEENIAHVGGKLLVVEGKSVDLVPKLAKDLAVARVVAQAWTEPFARARDRIVRERLHVPLELVEGELLTTHGTVKTGQGEPFSVYTPFARAFRRDVKIGKPIPAPKVIPAMSPALTKLVKAHVETRPVPTLGELGITENTSLVRGGERAARERLASFVSSRIARYDGARDLLAIEGTSRLSQDLKFGVLSPRAVWAAAAKSEGVGAEKFANELLWREFTHHILDARPNLLEHPFRQGFRNFPYLEANAEWTAWVEGKTGYPVVDAAARELLHDGYVHNRARMITASFLTKHLLISYRRGEAHYMKFLTDGDWAQNNAGWQWSAGSGVDAQPYFRVFNPVTQGQKFDPDGGYVKRWLPELAKLDTKYLHAPWEAPPLVLAAAGVTLGKTYPRPIVDHTFARDRFLKTATAHLKP